MNLKHTKVANLAAALITFISLAGGANAAILLTITDDGTDLTMTATGSYDFTAVGDNGTDQALGANAGVLPTTSGGLYGWEVTEATISFTVSYSGALTGTSNVFPADSITTTNPFFFDSSRSVIRFTEGTPLLGTVNETAVFNSITLASLGMVAGESVSVTWAGDSATIQTVASVPEPSSAILLGLGALGVAVHRRRIK